MEIFYWIYRTTVKIFYLRKKNLNNIKFSNSFDSCPVIIFSLEFFTSASADGLSLEFEWKQVSRTLLSIMAVLNNVAVWMVSTRPPTSKSSSPFSNPLIIIPNSPITIGIIVTFMFQSFFNSLARSKYFFSNFFSFILWSAGTAMMTIFQVLFFC